MSVGGHGDEFRKKTFSSFRDRIFVSGNHVADQLNDSDVVNRAWKRWPVHDQYCRSRRTEEDLGLQVLDAYRAQPADSINSILADRLAGRPMEIDARNGVIVRKGEKHRIRTPSNRMVVALLHALQRGSILGQRAHSLASFTK
jgi:hypothetical protein